MKKLLYRFTFISLIVVLIINYITDPIFNFDDSYFKSTINDYNEQDSIDMIFLGSSHSLNSYNPQVFDTILGLNSFNLSSAAQKLNTSEYLIQSGILKKQPKVVVLDLFYFAVSEDVDKQTGLQLIVYNNTKNTLNKISKVVSNYGLSYLPSTMSPTIRNHNQWYNLYVDDENSKDKTIKGFVPLKKIISKKDRKKFKNFKENLSIIKNQKLNFNGVIPREKVKQIARINDLLNEKNIELVLVSAPYLNYSYSKNNRKFHLLIEHVSDSLNINYIDLNKSIDKLNLDISHFNDKNHLNLTGANIVSDYLAKYIAEKLDYKILVDSLSFIKKNKPLKRNSLEETKIAFRSIDKKLAENFNISHFGSKRVNSNTISFSFRLNDDITLETINKYSMGIKVFSSDLKTPRLYSFQPKIEIKGGNKYINKNIKEIKSIDSLDVYIYKKNDWKTSGRLGGFKIYNLQ